MAAKNPPFLVGTVLLLVILSVISIVWSFLLLFCANVAFFTLRTNLVWCFLVNLCGFTMCALKLYKCNHIVVMKLLLGMHHYRTSPVQKHFLDNLQWSLSCCGLKSYRDWFNQDWYDKIRDYEWDSSREKRMPHNGKASTVDSVPQSCCKTGSCISNYLTELGTFSINTRGCKDPTQRLMMIYLIIHGMYFSVVMVLQFIVLKYSTKFNPECNVGAARMKMSRHDVRHIMSIRDNFRPSSESYLVVPDESNESSNM